MDDVWDYNATETTQNNLLYDEITNDFYEKPRETQQIISEYDNKNITNEKNEPT